MATVKQYVNNLRNRQDVVARKMGASLRSANMEVRVLNLTLLTLVAVIVKTLVDKGVTTDAELNSLLTGVADDIYTIEPVNAPIED